jgi:hypothetical protein
MKIPSWLPQHSRPLKFFPNFPVDFLDQLGGWGRGGEQEIREGGWGGGGGRDELPSTNQNLLTDPAVAYLRGLDFFS